MKLKISVTKQDIKRGKPRHASKCPVTLAIKRELHKAKVKFKVLYVRASTFGWEQYNMDKGWFPFMREQPEKVFKFVNRFDNNKKVKPFQFCLYNV